MYSSSSVSTKKVAVPAPGISPKKARHAVVRQHGGTHYEQSTGMCPMCGFAGLEHWDLYAEAPYLEGSATKYITRWRRKGGVEDLRKAITVLEKIMAVEALKQKKAPKQPSR
jgi:ribosomal protein L37E